MSLDRALPGWAVDLIRDGVPAWSLKASGHRAIMSALTSTAWSAQLRGWDVWEWEGLLSDPKSHLGAQCRRDGKGKPVRPKRVQTQYADAWEWAWSERAKHQTRDVEALAADAVVRAQIVGAAVADADVDLSGPERALLAHVVARVADTGWLTVVVTRATAQEVTGLGSTAVRGVLASLDGKGLLVLGKAGRQSTNPKNRRGSTYGFPAPNDLAGSILKLTEGETMTNSSATEGNVRALTPKAPTEAPVEAAPVVAIPSWQSFAETAGIGQWIAERQAAEDARPDAVVLPFRRRTERGAS